jgi:hypothetical protein
MNKKNFILIGLVLVLAVIYAIHFTNWFRTETMSILCAERPARNGAAATRLFFSLGDDYELTEVKVVPLAALQADKHAQPVWHLVGDPSSDLVNTISYGQNIGGMTAAVEGSRAEPLQPGVTYRIFVTAGKIRGEHDFHIGVATGK